MIVNEIRTDRFRNEDWRFLAQCYAYTEKVQCINRPIFVYRNNLTSTAHTGNSEKALISCLDGYREMAESTQNKYIQQFCYIWMIGAFFELMEYVSIGDTASTTMKRYCGEYDIDNLVHRGVWISDKNMKKYNLMKQDWKRFILLNKIKMKLRNGAIAISKVKFIRILYYKKKYPIFLGR